MKADEEIVVREEASGVTAAADAWRAEDAERDALVKAVEGEHMRAELERLRAENASLRARGSDARSAPAPTGA